MIKKSIYQNIFVSLVFVFLTAAAALAQTTAFTYQGKLSDAGTPATGNYDMQFLLFDTPDVSTGTQQGATITNPTVPVASGVFSVQLDFGQGVFDGSARYLEIAVRPAGSKDPYTTLSPRQAITATPYSVRSMNAAAADGLSVACVNCITSSQIASVEGARISGAIPVESVPTGSGNYIQNASASVAARGGRPAVAQEGGFDLTGDGMLGGNLIVNGQVGLGIATPLPGFRLDVVGSTRISPGGLGGVMQFHTPNSETGITFGANNRADIRFNDSTLKLVVTTGGIGPPPSTNGVSINTLGNVGIGVVSADSKLQVNSSVAGVSAIFAESASGRGVWGKSTSSRGVFGESASAAGVQGISNTGTGVVGSSTSGWGVDGASASPAGFGGHFSNTGGGKALKVEGTGSIGVLEITGGLDLAEHFDVVEGARPGMLVAINPRNTAQFSLSRGAYNRKVAGVISGANNLAAGMVLSNLAGGRNSMPVALTGRVWVYCDATTHAIVPGDLLTTSSTPGHAMKVISYKRAQGAIIGKAMSGLKTGRGLVLVLVSLQ
jgi:hypothetical protein